MTTETKIGHIVNSAKVDVLSEILGDATTLIKQVKIPLSDVGRWSVDMEYDEDYYIEVSCKFIKKLQVGFNMMWFKKLFTRKPKHDRELYVLNSIVNEPKGNKFNFRDLKYIFTPSFWFMNYKYSPDLDRMVRYAINKDLVRLDSEYWCTIGSLNLWIGNYPFSFGKIHKRRPGRRTIELLNKHINNLSSSPRGSLMLDIDKNWLQLRSEFAARLLDRDASLGKLFRID